MSERSPDLRRTLGAIGAPVVALALWLAPLPLEAPAHRLAAVFGLILLLWVSEVIPIAATALLIAPLLTVTAVYPPADAFKHYANPLLYLFVGGFFIAVAMSVHGLDRRLAHAIVGHRLVGGRPSRVRIALMVAGGLLSMWISNTATCAILVPILLGMVGPGFEKGRGALLATAYGCSVGGLGTLVGSPPNLITVDFLGEAGHELSFLDWMAVSVPTALAVMVGIYLVIARMHPTPERFAGIDDDGGAPPPGAWSQGERWTALAFGMAVLGWMVPGLIRALDGNSGAAELVASIEGGVGIDLPTTAELKRALHPGVVAVLASSILFMLPDGKGSRVLTWKQAAGIDWGIILLFGGGIALGRALVDTGLAEAISQGFVAATGIRSLWTLTAFSVIFTIFFTEVCSNTASATMLVPLTVGIANELGVSPVPPALGVGLAASCAFMLPIATGPNAIVYSTGRIPQPIMIRTGLVLNLVGAVIVYGVLRALCPLYGWT